MAVLLETTEVTEVRNMLAQESHAIMWFAKTTGAEYEDNWFEVKQHLDYVQTQLLHYAAIGLITYEPFAFPAD